MIVEGGMYDFDEWCCGARVRARRRWPLGVELRIEPNAAGAWEETLQPQEAAAVADALEGLSSGAVHAGLSSLSVRRDASKVEVSVTGVMLRAPVAVVMFLGAATRLASVLRPAQRPPAGWSSGTDRRRDGIMRRIFS
jgi:hypothetical protein